MHSSVALHKKIIDFLLEDNIPASLKGYRFLKKAIEIAVTLPEESRKITKYLYPTIAAVFDDKPTRVERAIRHAISHSKNYNEYNNSRYVAEAAEHIIQQMGSESE